jgi:hypothetical protein
MGTLGCILWFAGLGIVGARYWRARIQRWREGMSVAALQGFTAFAVLVTFSSLLWVVLGDSSLVGKSWVMPLLAAAGAWVLFVCLAEWWKRTPSFSTPPSDAAARLREQDTVAASIKQALQADQRKPSPGQLVAPPPGVPMAQSPGQSSAQSTSPPLAQPAPRHAMRAPVLTHATPAQARPRQAPRPSFRHEEPPPAPSPAPALTGSSRPRKALLGALERHATTLAAESPTPAVPSALAGEAAAAEGAPAAAGAPAAGGEVKPPAGEAGAAPTSEGFTYQPKLIESRFGKKE